MGSFDWEDGALILGGLLLGTYMTGGFGEGGWLTNLFSGGAETAAAGGMSLEQPLMGEVGAMTMADPALGEFVGDAALGAGDVGGAMSFMDPGAAAGISGITAPATSLGSGIVNNAPNISNTVKDTSALQSAWDKYIATDNGFQTLLAAGTTLGAGMMGSRDKKKDRKLSEAEKEKDREFGREQREAQQEFQREQNELNRQFQAAQQEQARAAAEARQKMSLGVQAAQGGNRASNSALAAMIGRRGRGSDNSGLFRGTTAALLS